MDTIVYFGSGFRELETHGARRAEDGSLHVIRGGVAPQTRRRLVMLDDLPRAVSYTRHRPVDALLLDARGPSGLERSLRMLEVLFPHGRMGGPLSKRRVLALVGGGAHGVGAAFALGQHGIGGVLAEPSPEQVHARLDELLSGRGHGKVAICMAGGGIEGLLYEIGVLRALESFLPHHAVVDVDFFCGISAGAILGALLANGIGPDEILRALDGDSRRVAPIGRWDLFEPNLGEVMMRLWRLFRELSRGGAGPRGALSSLARAVPSAVFSGRRLGRWLEQQLTRPGMADRFEDLRRPLYVGATDQDTSQAVLFGDETHRDVPLHRAVRASCALVPFYPSVEVQGRRYIDGAFSRTTNMRVAAQLGATLVILIDPLVPVRAAEAGYVYARGGIFGTAQGLKALINGRFDKAVHAIAEMHPNVAFHLFRPKGEEMRILSGSPMKYFFRREVADIAYETTVEEIRASLPQLARDFALHGIELRDPERVSRPRAPHPVLTPSALGI